VSAGDRTPGRRGADGDWNADRQPGEYWRNGDRWCGITPRFDHYVDVTTWTVTEHDDGTITVSPSIFGNKDRPSAWHGFLERGVWREV
jgi:hypothetical protein